MAIAAIEAARARPGPLARARRRLAAWRRRRDKRAQRRHVLDWVERGSVCAEIGVWKGDFAAQILGRRPAALHLVDPWQWQPQFRDRIYGARPGMSQAAMDAIFERVQQRFRRHPGVQIQRAPSEAAAARFADASLDFVYLDADHGYAAVRRDLELWTPKLRPGGVLAGDDYAFARCPEGGPRRAVAEAVAAGALEWISLRNEQWILRRARNG